MSEVINNFEDVKDKKLNQISKDIADYIIQKKQTEKDGEYIGKIDRIDRLKLSSDIKNNLTRNESAIQEYIDMLKKDFFDLEFTRQNFYHMGKMMTLAIELQELDPTIMIEVQDTTKEEFRQQIKTEFSYLLYPLETDKMKNLSIEQRNEYLNLLANEYINSDFSQDYNKFIQYEVDSEKILNKFLTQNSKQNENIEDQDKSKKIIDSIIYNFNTSYEEWGKQDCDTKAEFITNFIYSEFYDMGNDFQNTEDWRDYIELIPELKQFNPEVEDYENEDLDKIIDIIANWETNLLKEYDKSQAEDEINNFEDEEEDER